VKPSGEPRPDQEDGPRWLPRAAAALTMLLTLTQPTQAQENANDPLEPLNRTIFGWNQLLDMMFIAPAATVYGHLPQPARSGVRNVLDNLGAPVVFANDLLQGERDRAGVTLARFMINSLVGIGGVFDLATDFGYPKHSSDLGQTLGKWGVGEGPYLVLPLLGPSNPRDALGRLTDGFIDPFGFVAPTDVWVGRTVANGVDTRYRLDPVIEDVQRNSLDPYVTYRTAYRQRRAAEIHGDQPTPDADYEGIFNETDEPSTAP
jgi:phospholipid-binding lipoprotein MlaA